MARVDGHGALHHDPVSLASRRRKKKKPYKILYENVTQEKKKLRSAVSHHLRSPDGYTFVPAGKYPDLTETCKEFSRKKGAKVYVVSAAPSSRGPAQISHHIHRLGHHFQNEVLEAGCNYLGYHQRGALFWKDQDLASSSRLATLLARRNSTELEETKQIEIAIRDLFPKIPEEDLKSIAKRAFEEGSGRVGTIADLSLERRVQLAVIAHIRHVYTDYDEQLRKGTWGDARRHVEQACIDQVVKWRGEDDSDTHELEDIFQEIIVIDGESSEGQSSETDETDSDDGGLQIVSSPKEPHELMDEDFGPTDLVGGQRPSNVRNLELDGRLPRYETTSQTLAPFLVQRHMQPPRVQHERLRQAFRDRYQAAQNRGRERQFIQDGSSTSLPPTSLSSHADQKLVVAPLLRTLVADRPHTRVQDFSRSPRLLPSDRAQAIVTTRSVPNHDRISGVIPAYTPKPRPFIDATGRRWIPEGQQVNVGLNTPKEYPRHPASESTGPLFDSPTRRQTQASLPLNPVSEHDVPLPSVEEDIQSYPKSQFRAEIKNGGSASNAEKPAPRVMTDRTYTVAQPKMHLETDMVIDEPSARKRPRLSQAVDSVSHANTIRMQEASNSVELTNLERPRTHRTDYLSRQGFDEGLEPVSFGRLVHKQYPFDQAQSNTSRQKRLGHGFESGVRYIANSADDTRYRNQPSSYLTQVTHNPSRPLPPAQSIPVRSHSTFPNGELRLPERLSQRDHWAYDPNQISDRIVIRDLDQWRDEDRQSIRRTSSDQAIPNERCHPANVIDLTEAVDPHVRSHDIVRHEPRQSSARMQTRARDSHRESNPADGGVASQLDQNARLDAQGQFDGMHPRLQIWQDADGRELVRLPSKAEYSQHPLRAQGVPREIAKPWKTYSLQATSSYADP